VPTFAHANPPAVKGLAESPIEFDVDPFYPSHTGPRIEFRKLEEDTTGNGDIIDKWRATVTVPAHDFKHYSAYSNVKNCIDFKFPAGSYYQHAKRLCDPKYYDGPVSALKMKFTPRKGIKWMLKRRTIQLSRYVQETCACTLECCTLTFSLLSMSITMQGFQYNTI
jgi:hypothetical protein